MSKNDSESTGNAIGRPKKGEGPRIPYSELDRILVFGEVVECDDGKGTTVVYPSYRDLGRRYGVSHSLIADFAKKHNCMRRREVAQARIAEKTDQKLIEMRAQSLAMSKDDELRSAAAQRASTWQPSASMVAVVSRPWPSILCGSNSTCRRGLRCKNG